MEKMPVFFLAFCGARDRLAGNDAFRIVALNTKFTHMKKLFLAFTAFVGMLTGLSLTSCGGGGGGGNLAGTVLYMTSNGSMIRTIPGCWCGCSVRRVRLQ